VPRVGAHLLVGLTHHTLGGEVERHEQFHGRVARASSKDGVILVDSAGEEHWLPPTRDSYVPADPGEYRLRSAELHAQVMTLKMVKTSGTLMAELKSKLADTSERMQKTTIAIVDTQEELMLIKVKFQNQLADLKLVDKTKKSVSKR
jgi:hypothetical protein